MGPPRVRVRVRVRVFSTMPRKLHRAKRANGGKFLVVERIFGESLILAIHL